MHVPVGVLNAFLFISYPMPSMLFGIGFLTYEISQCWRISDNAFKDIIGWLWGFGAGLIIMVIWGLLW